MLFQRKTEGMINLNNENDLIQLAAEVLKQYKIIPQDIKVIQGDSIKTVWKVTTNDELLCLKRLKQTIDKALFSVNAQIYIKNSGGNVPKIILNNQDQPITIFNEQLFVVYQWLEGKDLNFGNNEDLNHAVKGLAKFHKLSKGYIPPDEARISTKEGKWPAQYDSMMGKLIEWKEVAQNNKSVGCYGAYLNVVDPIIEIGKISLEMLKNSNYENLTNDQGSLVLCHQDYGRGNAILTNDGVIVLDLDGVTFDLPSRDLRKIIGKQAETKGLWDEKLIGNVVSWYSEINMISEEDKRILYIDLLFPHWFFGCVKNLFKNNKLIKSEQIEKTAKLEQSKVLLLKKLIKRGG